MGRLGEVVVIGVRWPAEPMQQEVKGFRRRGVTEKVRLKGRKCLEQYNMSMISTHEISVCYLTERWKAKLSGDPLLSIDVDGDQVLTKWSTARDVNYSH